MGPVIVTSYIYYMVVNLVIVLIFGLERDSLVDGRKDLVQLLSQHEFVTSYIWGLTLIL